MTEKEKMLAGKIYDSSDKELAELRTKAHKLSQQYSSLYEDDERRKAILDELLPDRIRRTTSFMSLRRRCPQRMKRKH